MDSEERQSSQHREIPRRRGNSNRGGGGGLRGGTRRDGLNSSPNTNVHSFNKPFLCLYTNADSVMNKRQELIALIEIYNPQIIAITEVKPKNLRFNIQECEVSIEGYELFHNLNDKGRGICLYIKTELKPSVIVFDTDFEEVILTECFVNNDKLTIGLFYRSPTRYDKNDENVKKRHDENLTNLNALIQSISDKKPENLLLLGDFNFPQIDWDKETTPLNEDSDTNKFLKQTKDAFLIQHVLQPTRYREGQKATLDDLVFSNNEKLVNDIEILPPLGKSDHMTLIVDLALIHKPHRNQERRNFYKGDYEAMRKDLEGVEWDKEFEHLSADEAWNTFKEKINGTIENNVPLSKINNNKRRVKLNEETLELVRRKHKLYRKWLETFPRNQEYYNDYKKANNKASKACRKARRDHEKKVADQAKTNPKAFWSYTSQKLKTRTGIADLKRDDGTKTATDKEKADLLNTFFQSVFTIEKDEDLPTMPEPELRLSLEDFDIKVEEVKKLLKGLKPGKAPGPDGLNPKLLSELADIIALPITQIFKLSLATGKIPEEWRKAKVSPIFKKGSRLSANNYRPVSLTCILCKMMETLVRKHLINHLEENKIVSRHQHGFTAGRSCITQLLETLDIWTEVLDNGGSIDVVYTDFMKAFDSVPHRRLVSKAEAYGVRGKVLRWISDFLTNRSQVVCVNEAVSEPGAVTSGIPQGSVLGPVLFVIYINDLPDHVKSDVKIFADDTKVFTRSDIKENRVQLQEDLDNLNEWSSNWKLRFHPEKCSVMRIGRSEVKTDYTMIGTNPNGEKVIHTLKESKSEKDLGVIIDNELSFKEHIATATAKANKIVGLIRRTFDYLTPDTFVQLYKAIVRPILEYGHSVYQPRHKTLCQDLEDVQRRATRLIGNMKEMSYPERLKKLKLPSLEFRRERGDLIDVYKYVENIYDTDHP